MAKHLSMPVFQGILLANTEACKLRLAREIIGIINAQHVCRRYPPPPLPPPPPLTTTMTSKLIMGGTSKQVCRNCTIEGCRNCVVQGGLCIARGAKRKQCKHPGCAKHFKKAGLCSTHGPAQKRCELKDCHRKKTRSTVLNPHRAKEFAYRVLLHGTSCVHHVYMLDVPGTFFNATHQVKAIAIEISEVNPLVEIGDCCSCVHLHVFFPRKAQNRYNQLSPNTHFYMALYS